MRFARMPRQHVLRGATIRQRVLRGATPPGLRLKAPHPVLPLVSPPGGAGI
jgi:hypothetical protein